MEKTLLRLLVALSLILISVHFLLHSCASDRTEHAVRQWNVLSTLTERQHPLPTPVEGEALVGTVRALPENLTSDQLESQLSDLFRRIGLTKPSERPQVYEALAILRRQRDITNALVRFYGRLPKESFYDRLLTIQVLGELQRKDAYEHLTAIIRAPLPEVHEDPLGAEKLSSRDHEEMIQAAAVQGLAFLREEDGLTLGDSSEELVRIAKNHPSKAVRISSIDAFMWNHGDTKEAADKLKSALTPDYHMYLDRPRFYRGADRAGFHSQLNAWRIKWHR